MNIIEEVRRIAQRCENYGMYEIAKDALDIADCLERSGALVPVPDGEACRVEALYNEERLVKHDGKIYCGADDGSGYAAIANTKPDFPNFDDDTIVQPVRLVPIAEAEL